MHCLWKGCESLDACVVAVLLGVQQGFDGFWWFDGFAGVRQAGRACADAGQACRIMRGVLEGLSRPGAQHLLQSRCISGSIYLGDRSSLQGLWHLAV